MNITGDPQLDAMYAELDEFIVKRQAVLDKLRDMPLKDAREQLRNIDTRKQMIWDGIRRRKVERSASSHGEQVPRPPSQTGRRKARWEE